jgi:hypothetical protein
MNRVAQGPLPAPHPKYEGGQRVSFEAPGLRGSGVVDASMADGSIIWVWLDDAMGRRMLCLLEDGVAVSPEESPTVSERRRRNA